MRIYDISLPIDPALAIWPGDAPYRLDWTARRGSGQPVNLGSVSMSLHTGSHVDAPFHFDSLGPTTDQLPAHTFIGPATVVDVCGHATISTGLLEQTSSELAPRVLLYTGAWADRTRFPACIPVMDTDVPAYLRSKGVVLVGVDVPSVDPLDSKELASHHALGENGIAILESLLLDGVPAGGYELIAVPLRLIGADASPVRALLRSL